MDVNRLYFLENPEWYEEADIFKDGFFEGDRGYRLTDKAPQEAIDSYNEFYGITEEDE